MLILITQIRFGDLKKLDFLKILALYESIFVSYKGHFKIRLYRGISTLCFFDFIETTTNLVFHCRADGFNPLVVVEVDGGGGH